MVLGVFGNVESIGIGRSAVRLRKVRNWGFPKQKIDNIDPYRLIAQKKDSVFEKSAFFHIG